MLKRTIKIALVLLLASSSLTAVADAPDWLRNLARQTSKKYADDVNAVLLLAQDETTVNDKGEIIEHGRRAYRILRPEGRDYATLQLAYNNETKVNYVRGWSITAAGQEYEAKDKDSIEMSLSTFEVYSDDKAKFLRVSGADAGSVVGFEFERKGRPYVFDDSWSFQREIPVERCQYTLRIPSSWEMRAYWVNHAEQTPKNENGAYIWELTDIPPIEREISRPPYEALAGRMIVTFASDKFKAQTYNDWNSLAAWHAQLYGSVFDTSTALQQKVQELAPATMAPLERIRALARFAQKDIRYAAIEIGIGGLKPHPASEVFSNRYGDCKDKATLLKAMLSQIGVKSYLMPIQTERGVYTEKSPPSLGFNHVIIAIQFPEASTKTELSALYIDPKYGRLLIFDPTNDLVPFGQIPYYEQGNFALLVAENGGELVHLPMSSAEANRITRVGNLKLLADGTLQGEVEETRTGYFAAVARDLKDISIQDRKKVMEHILGRTLANFQVDSFEVVNADDIDKDLVLRYKFTVANYAKNAGSLLLVRPRVVGEMAGYYDSTKPRLYAYEFNTPFTDSDNIEIALPDGFQVDELPDPAKAAFPFGEYTSKTEKDGNSLKYHREYKMENTLIPLDKMNDLKRMFGQINMDEKNMAVLKKAN
ncbi:MAG TPA: DUF3857 domain-containing protein [Candidatus Angelobacter sp.]|nr:DUF3857 domain-containing protein [Candidatus Angelobacter sp.]